jgi:hypothetical protein
MYWKNPGKYSDFLLEEHNTITKLQEYGIGSLLTTSNVKNVDVLMCDIQGAEDFLFKNEIELLKSEVVRFALISTHHHSISGNPTLHEELIEFLLGCGGHIICEHTIPESYSGDGLIAVSFSDQDKDFKVDISRNRARNSLFIPYEFEIKSLQKSLGEASLDGELIAHLNKIENSLSWGITSPLRRLRKAIQMNTDHSNG